MRVRWLSIYSASFAAGLLVTAVKVVSCAVRELVDTHETAKDAADGLGGES